MTGHTHAALMADYAQDAAETDKPWARWQFKRPGEGGWRAFDDAWQGPNWLADHEYRRKPVPVELWVNVYDTGMMATFTSEAAANNASCQDRATRIAVHMREVVE
jgi:hypothetical protein